MRRTTTPADLPRWFPPDEVLLGTDEASAMVRQFCFEAFCLEAITTIDEHGVGAREPLPIYTDHMYLRVAIQMLVRLRTIYWLKSRKVSATWLLLMWMLWTLMSRRDALCGWVAPKLGDGEIVLGRLVKGPIASLPDWVLDMYEFSTPTGKVEVVSFKGKPWGSTLLAYPKGADQLRVLGHTKIAVDEAHLITDLAELLQGCTPGLRAAEGKPGGQLMLVGVGKRGSHFHKLLDPTRSGTLEVARQMAMERLTPVDDLPAVA